MLLTFVLAGLVTGAAYADDHVVAQDASQARVRAEAGSRAQDLATVRGALQSAEVARVASRTGVDLARVQGGLSGLSDAELHDVALRAQSLHVDPRSGMESDVDDLLIIFLLVALVILVVRAA
jgi:hypothetical protein